MTDKKVLLHACCGICSGYPISYLIDNGYQVTVYFTNDNLDTLAEYQRRLEEERRRREAEAAAAAAAYAEQSRYRG